MALPRTDLSVSPLCLGTNRFGAELDRDATFAMLDTLVELGGNFIDTAGVYADWHAWAERSCSEKMIGRWRAARGDISVIIATKGGHPRGESPKAKLDPATLMADARASRENLGVAAIDLYYVHRDDITVAVEDILGTLEDLHAEGVIRWYAASNWTGARLSEAATVAKQNGWHGFVAHQPEWSLARRNPGTAAGDLLTADADTLAVHAALDLPLIPYSAQAKGYFDKLRDGVGEHPALRIYDNPRNRNMAAVLAPVAMRLAATPTQVMLAYMQALNPIVVPIVGCYALGQLRQTWASLDLFLTAAEIAAIGAAAQN